VVSNGFMLGSKRQVIFKAKRMPSLLSVFVVNWEKAFKKGY